MNKKDAPAGNTESARFKRLVLGVVLGSGCFIALCGIVFTILRLGGQVSFKIAGSSLTTNVLGFAFTGLGAVMVLATLRQLGKKDDDSIKFKLPGLPGPVNVVPGFLANWLAAESISRRKSRPGPLTCSEDLFEAMVLNASRGRGIDPGFAALLAELVGKGAIAKPSPQDIPAELPGRDEERPVSDDILQSMERLGRASGRKRAIRADDLFVDIARHGSEAPVKRLREHGIDAAELDRCVTRHKMDVLETLPEMDASEQGLRTALALKSQCRPLSEVRRAGEYDD